MTANSRDVAARHPDIPQDALFDIDAEPVVKTKKRPVKPLDHADCPTCPAEAVARELRNGVLTWRAHMRRTIRGVGLPCSMSDQPVDGATVVELCAVEGCLNPRRPHFGLDTCDWHAGLGAP